MNKLVLFLIGIVLIGIAGFAMVWFGAGRKLQAPAVAFLIQCRDGEYQKAYDATHESFREGQSLEQMQALWEHWKTEHGVFGEVLQRLSVRVQAASGSPWSRSITLELGFYNGHMLGRFYFVTVDEVPQLVHVWIAPKPIVEVEASDRSSLEPSARALFAKLAAGEFTALYDALDPELQMMWTQKTLQKEMGALLANTGALGHITLVRTEDEEDGGVAQSFDVQFANAKVKFRVTHKHDRGQWSVVGLLGE